MEHVEQHQAGPAMDLEESREPLPVFPPQAEDRSTRVIRRAKRPRPSTALRASELIHRGEIRHHRRFLVMPISNDGSRNRASVRAK